MVTSTLPRRLLPPTPAGESDMGLGPLPGPSGQRAGEALIFLLALHGAPYTPRSEAILHHPVLRAPGQL